MPFQFERLEIADLVLVQSTTHQDDRGVFAETYRYSEFAAFGIRHIFVQDAYSRSRRGVLRGLHFQKEPRAQGKLVRVALGEIFDVAVDVRATSATYGRWLGVHLSAENNKMLYIPPGFAHGFCVTSEIADVCYKMTHEHAGDSEGGILWNDPDLAIAWPLSQPTISSRDAALPRLRDAITGP